MNIDGTSVVVTGGASGLGEATVRRFVELGLDVAFLDGDAARGKALADELGPAATFVAGDVTNQDDVAAVIDVAAQRASLRIAVSCAGIAQGEPLLSPDGRAAGANVFRRVVEVNLFGTFNVLRLAAQAIAANEPLDDGERGVIVNTASIAATDAGRGRVAYAASKAAVVGMTLPAARDLSDLGIRVCTIAPGTFLTPPWESIPARMRDEYSPYTPFPKRFGRPDEFATLVEHIARNSYLNAETIRLDAGIRTPMAPSDGQRGQR